MPEDPSPYPAQPPPLPGPIRHDFDLVSNKNRTSFGLGAALAIALLFSGLAAVFLSAVFWALAIQSPSWMYEGFYGKPIGLIEPFEAYSQIVSTEPEYSDLSDSEEEVELGSQPGNLWDRWRLQEFLTRTGGKNPYSVFPTATSQEEFSKRRQAFEQYEKEIENESEAIESALNQRAFLIDAAAYFLIFAAISSAFAVMVHATWGKARH